MLERTAVNADRRQGTSRPSVLRHRDPLGREQRFLGAGHHDEKAGEHHEQRPVDLVVDPLRLDRAGHQQEGAAEHRGLGRLDAGEEGDGERDADEARLGRLPDMHPAAERCGSRSPLNGTPPDRRATRRRRSRQAEGRDRRERGRKGGIGNARIGADHHVLRVAGDGRHAAAVGGGRGRDQIGQRVEAERPRDREHDRRHDEADRVVTRKAESTPASSVAVTRSANGRWACSIASAPSARKAPETLRCATTIIIPSRSAIGVEVDGVEGVVEATTDRRRSSPPRREARCRRGRAGSRECARAPCRRRSARE